MTDPVNKLVAEMARAVYKKHNPSKELPKELEETFKFDSREDLRIVIQSVQRGEVVDVKYDVYDNGYIVLKPEFQKFLEEK